MTPVYILYSLLASLLVSLTETTDLSSLCDEILTRPASYRVQIMCDQLTAVLHKLHTENELGYEWVPSTRISRDTSSAESALHKSDMLLGNLRVRRGGNYIRFGRSVSSPHSSLLHSFGNSDKRSDGHYVRFGRSIPDIPHENNEIDDKLNKEKRFMRFGKRADAEAEEKRFMRFGRDPLKDENKIDEEKRFMRFGKKDAGMADENKRFMRFGKREDEDDTDGLKEDDEKRFMRFGRGGNDVMSDKRFMRFGKSVGLSDDSLDYETAGKRFMRFGKRTEDEVAKRFMRFGKRGDDQEAKRFMRFGKRFMRFGRDPQEAMFEENSPLESKDIQEGKRFMRFGKRFHEEGDLKNNVDVKDEEKRFMRFGKKSEGTASAFGSDKRFMRFGKREDSSS